MKRVWKEYRLEFQKESVRRYLKNNRKLTETAKELGIHYSTLKGWCNKYMSEINIEKY
jgi:transposase-like protein